MDIELISSVAGILVSLALSYIPKADTWYAALDNKQKALVVLGATTLAVVVIWAAGCLEIWGACILDWRVILRSWIAAVLSGQGTYLLSPQTSWARKADDAAWMTRMQEPEFSNDDDYRNDPA